MLDGDLPCILPTYRRQNWTRFLLDAVSFSAKSAKRLTVCIHQKSRPFTPPFASIRRLEALFTAWCLLSITTESRVVLVRHHSTGLNGPPNFRGPQPLVPRVVVVMEPETPEPERGAPRLAALLAADKMSGGCGQKPRRNPRQALENGWQWRATQAAIDVIVGLTKVDSEVGALGQMHGNVNKH